MESKTIKKHHRHHHHTFGIDDVFEYIILGLFVAMFVIVPFSRGGASGWGFPLLEIITVLTLLCWVIRLWIDKTHRFLFTPTSWAVLGLTLYGVFQWKFVARVPYDAGVETFRILTYCTLFFLFINNLRKHKLAEIFFAALLIIASLISIYAIYQFSSGNGSILGMAQPAVYAKRASGIFVYPNHLAGFLVMLIPMSLSLVISGRIGYAHRILSSLACVIMLMGLAVTVSRAGYIIGGFGICALLLILGLNRKYRLPAALAAVVIGIMSIWFFSHSPVEQIRTDAVFTDTFLGEGRGAIYKASWEMAQNVNPVVGCGTGSYASMIHRYLSPKMQADPVYAHSDYLQLLIEWGYVGIVGLLALLTIAGIGGWKAWQHVKVKENATTIKDSNRSAMFLGAAIGFTCILLYSAVDFNLRMPLVAMLALVLLGHITATEHYATKQFWFRQNVGIRVVVTVIAVILGCALLYNGAVTLQANNQEQAALKSKDTMGKYALFEKIDKLLPNDWLLFQEQGAHLERLAREAATDEEFTTLLQQTLQCYEKAAAANPLHYEPDMHRCIILTLLGKYEAARAAGEKMLTKAPNYAHAHSAFGWTQFIAGKTDDAVFHLKKAMEYSSSKDPTALQYLPQAMERQGKEKRYD